LIAVKLGQKGFKQERRRSVESSSLLCKRRALNRREANRYEFFSDIAGHADISVDRLRRAMGRLDHFGRASSTSWDTIVVGSVSDWVLL